MSHLLCEKENEVSVNRFPGPPLTGVAADYDAFLWQRHKRMAAQIKTRIRTVQTHGASD